MANLSGATLISAQELYASSTTRYHKLGQLGVDDEGNRYRYARAGGTALVTGHLLQEAAEDTNFRSMVASAASAIGSKTISVTLGGTAVTANLFDGGSLIVESGTGLGQKFTIVSHTVQTSTTGEVVFTLDRPVKIALVATTSQVTVRRNPYAAVIDNPTTQTGGVVGVALYALAASSYGWILSGGDGPGLFDTGTNTSDGVMGVGPSGAVAGSLKPQTGAEGGMVIGFAREVASTDSTFGVVHYMID